MEKLIISYPDAKIGNESESVKVKCVSLIDTFSLTLVFQREQFSRQPVTSNSKGPRSF